MRKTLIALIAATALIGGCDEGQSGVAQPVAERWDPCSIPVDAIEATGLDPTFKESGLGDGIVVKDWSHCALQGPAVEPSYFLIVKSSESHTISEARQNESFLNGVDLTIGGRDAYRYHTEFSKSITNCSIAEDVEPGIVTFTVQSMGRFEIGADPCELVLKHATDLEKSLPAVAK